jgi:cyclic pyranopterin phosphate synthase
MTARRAPTVRARRGSVAPGQRLTHLDDRGAAQMVNVVDKPESHRVAIASAAVRMSRATLALVVAGGGKKGDALAAARLAGLSALKRTAEWIPLCHPVRVVGSGIALDADRRLPGIRIRVEVHAVDRTGVEMEAMVGASAAALTLYDMIKGVDRAAEIVAVRLDEKRGGRSGVWRRTGTETE